ncbi:MAG: bifunctional heptose 7-phosphate kinase/heptose 1-phosphate adenyltransferase [Saprospiraceae bacterium]|nr:bifunctional heptose 7-phosphate kinase/heptose 1-phosphate adenyltransferase [Saprospiraceae bacterium]
MQDAPILIAGDVILDRYIQGSTHRISPEAPVPIVKVDTDYYTLGGAANVAHNLANLGNRTTLLGCVGRDESGRWLHDLLIARNIRPELYLSADIPTTTKTRIISRNQQMIRFDQEKRFIHHPKSLEFFKHKFSEADYLIISDYDKGFCSEELLELMFSNKDKNALVFVDPKGRNWEKYNGAYLVKPNLAELEEICGHEIANEDEALEKFGMQVFRKYNFEHLLVTRGKAGMTHVSKEGVRHYPTQQVDVFDVSGAGDTAMAVLAYMICIGKSLDDAINAANLASGFVVTKPTTYAIGKAELESLLRKLT